MTAAATREPPQGNWTHGRFNPERGHGDADGSLQRNGSQEVMYESLKRMFDIIISTILLLLTFPLIAISMVMVCAGSTGPPLYRQRRLGHLGRIIAIYKI